YDNATCTGNVLSTEANVPLSGGTATSSTFTTPATAGAFSYRAHYNGDANYPARDAACEPFATSVITNSCPFVNPAQLGVIGAAPNFCTVLHSGSGKVDITGPAGQFQGNICVADNGKISMSGSNFLTNPGEVLLQADASCSGCKIAPNPPGADRK